MDMITHGTNFGEPVSGTGGDKFITFWQNPTFLKQMDRAGLEPGQPAWLPHPHINSESLCTDMDKRRTTKKQS